MHYQKRSGLLPALTTAVAVIFCSALADVSQAGVTLNGDGRVIQITDIILPGARYTADITYGPSYQEAFIDVGHTPTFFGNSGAAQSAASQMLAQSQGAWGGDPDFQSVKVPFNTFQGDGTNVDFWHYHQNSTSVNNYSGSVANKGPTQGWAKFTLTGVPEPTSLVLFGGLGALGMVGRRRRKS